MQHHRSITRNCVTCRCKWARPQPPLMGELPSARVTPDIVFSNVGVDYAGPVLIKLGAMRRPTVTKAYIAVFVSLSFKAVHLELLSNLSTEAFLACLRWFVSRHSKSTTIWSDHCTNFVGANRQLKDLYTFLRKHETEDQSCHSVELKVLIGATSLKKHPTSVDYGKQPWRARSDTFQGSLVKPSSLSKNYARSWLKWKLVLTAALSLHFRMKKTHRCLLLATFSLGNLLKLFLTLLLSSPLPCFVAGNYVNT